MNNKNIAGIIFLAFMGSACSFMSVERMIPEKSTITYPVTVALGKVTGSKKTMTLRYYLNDELYRETLFQSVKSSGIFRNTKKTGNARFVLNAKTIDQEYFPGAETFSFIFRIVAKYTLIDSQNNKVVYDRTLTAACKKTMSDEFGGPPRVRKATECAVKQNMQKLISTLGKNKELRALAGN